MLTPTTPYAKKLDSGLVMRSIAGPEDVDRLERFNVIIHGDDVTDFTRSLILHHPHTRPEEWLYIEDSATGEIVSSLCLIPWRWDCQGVTLKAGEMGIVGTHSDYRERGLIRALVARHAEMLEEGEYDLSHIQGIPYFYRQFGYDYAIPLVGGFDLELRQAPDGGAGGYTLRQAALDEIPALSRLYEAAAERLAIHTIRGHDTWQYMLEHSHNLDEGQTFYLVVNAEGKVVGYLGIAHQGFSDGLIVSEVSGFPVDAAEAALGLLKSLAVSRGKPHIRLQIPSSSDLVQAARLHDARDMGTYAWQIRIPDVRRLLLKLTPIFEQRLSQSPLSSLTGALTINLYREAFVLDFSGGRLLDVRRETGAEHSALSIPPHLLPSLVFGYRSIDELCETHHDVRAWNRKRQVLDVLFPVVDAYLYTSY